MRPVILLFLLFGLSLASLNANINLSQNIPDSLKTKLETAKSGSIEELLVFIQIGDFERSQTKLAISLQSYLSALNLATTKNELVLKAEINQKIASLYYSAKEYQKSLDYYLNALGYYYKLENKLSGLNTMISVARNFLMLSQADSALFHLNNGLRIAQAEGNNVVASQIFVMMGKSYYEKNDYPNATLYYQSANLIFQSNQEYDKLDDNLLKIGKILFNQKNYNAANSNIEMALTYAKRVDDIEIIGECLKYLGQIAQLSNRNNAAISYYQEVLDMKESPSIHSIKRDCNKNISEIYEARSNFSTAYTYEKQYNLYSLAVNQMAATYNEKLLKLQKQLHESERLYLSIRNTDLLNSYRSKNRFYIVITIVILFVLVISIALFSRKNRKKRLQFAQDLMDKQNALEDALKKLEDFNTTLETEVSAKTKEIQEELTKRTKVDIDLKKALKNAEDANYLKNAFLSNMSHEIRTPLNGIIGFSNLLVTELSIMENEELFEYANGILQSGDRLLHLLNNILDISRIEANDMEVKLTSCKVNEIIESVADLYKFKANEKHIKFNTKYTDVPDVIADEKNITKIINDIIENAVKYTDKGFINVVTDYIAEDKQVVISIKDTGIGIDESYLKHVFEAFRQESLGYSRNYQGAGLGLPLAKRLIKLMNGDIKVDSSKGIGTTVKIFLKTDIEETPPKQVGIPKEVVTLSDSITDEKINIFIVEDDRMNRLVLNKMLEKVGENLLAVDGDETIKIIGDAYEKGLIFDIMLFDINLPAPWDGIKLMHEVKKKWKEYKFVPFIAQTAYAMAGDRERLLDAGFDNYIPKPVNKNELINIIFKHISITKGK